MSSIVSAARPIALESVSMSRSRLWRAHWIDSKYEFLGLFRSPIIYVPLLAIPVAMYAFVGIILVHTVHLPMDPRTGLTVDLRTAQAGAFAGWVIFGVMGPAVMFFAVGVAGDRDSGLLAFRRALPMPPLGFLVSKALSSLMFASVVIGLMTVLCVLFSRADLSAAQHVQLFLAGNLMVLPFCALGLAIGASFTVQAAMALANVGWIGLAMLGGLLFSVPKWLAMWTPTYYAGQLSLGIVGLPTQTPAWLSVAVLSSLTVALGALAVRRINAVNAD